jgi:dTMP kinase
MTWYVIDGMDGSGKSTAAEMVFEHLQSKGRKVLVITHPNQATISGKLSSKFLHIRGKPSELMATGFYILDVLQSLVSMRRAGRTYDDYIFVRYIMAVGYLPEKLNGPAYDFISKVLPMPDVKIFIDLDAGTSMDRIMSRGESLEVFETEEKLDHVRKKMLRLTEDGWNVVDNSGTVESTNEQLERIVRRDGSKLSAE